MQQPAGVIKRLQALRFLAAGMVLFGHIVMELVQHEQSIPFGMVLRQMPWGFGVDLFFIISGFIISTISFDAEPSRFAAFTFVVKRIIRVWPPYAIFTALMLVATIAFRDRLQHANLDLFYTVASFFLVAAVRPDDGRVFPLLGQGWTLNYEAFFYALFSLTLFLPRAARTSVAILALLLTVALGTKLPGPVSQFYTNSILLEFAFGLFIATLYRRFGNRPVAGLAVLLLGVISLALGHAILPEGPRYLVYGVPAALIFAGVLFLGASAESILGSRHLVTLGDASYALYLSHPFVINTLLLVWSRLFPEAYGLFLPVSAVVAIATSVVFCVGIERPIIVCLSRALSVRVPHTPRPDLTFTGNNTSVSTGQNSR